MKAIFRPLGKWPGKPTDSWDRRRSPFSANYDDTLNLLERELGHLGASNVVIQMEIDAVHIRNGTPKSINLVRGPAVVVGFIDPAGDEYSYPCDTFEKYADNLRAIALALEALRKVDRYGVTQRGEQYQGFKALPPPEAAPSTRMTIADAAALIGSLAGVPGESIQADREVFEMMAKLAARRVHPDGASGSHDQFVKLQDAMTVLKEHFTK